MSDQNHHTYGPIGRPGRLFKSCTGPAVAFVVVFAISTAHSQILPRPQPAFEVASIRATDPAFTLKSLQLPLDDGRVTIRGFSLRQLIQYAWGNVGVGDGLHASLVSGGPGWVDRERFDIVAKSEGSRIPSRDERRQMLRELLTERFQLKLNQEVRGTAVYVLVVGKNGPKMKARKPGDGGQPFSLPFNALHITGWNVPMATLADTLQAIIPLTDPERDDRPVVDQTGLTGTFDFELAWSGDKTFSGGRGGMTSETSSAPDLFTAIQEQLGLRLELKKVPVKILVIDHAEKPADN